MVKKITRSEPKKPREKLPPREKVTLYLSPEIHNDIRRYCRENGYTINGYVLKLIKDDSKNWNIYE